MNIKNELEFQNINYNHLKNKFDSTKSYRQGKMHRISCIRLAEKCLKTTIKGVFIEIGAGTGYFSAYLLANRPDTSGIILECSDEAHNIIQDCMKAHLVDTKRYTITIDDFTKFVSSKPVDYIFVMGALHHSYALSETMETAYKNLKSGGYLIAHEPAFNDFFSRESLQYHYQHRLGIDSSVAEPTLPRYDFFFRECEYRQAAIKAGFDIVYWKLVEKYDHSIYKKILEKYFKPTVKSLIKMLTGKRNLHSTPMEKSQQKIQPNSYLMIFQKPISSLGPWIPHKNLL